MITLREAVYDDRALLQYWDQQPHVIASDPNDDWNWEQELTRHPPWREQLIACVDGEPVGFVQIIDPALEETHYWGEVESNLRAVDIWIGEEKNLERGYGTAIMKKVIERCFSDPGVRAILLDPLDTNTRAIRFYERLGFKKIMEKRFGADETMVMRLDRLELH